MKKKRNGLDLLDLAHHNYETRQREVDDDKQLSEVEIRIEDT